jgi:membrane protease YdiL (CAAX protease family)
MKSFRFLAVQLTVFPYCVGLNLILERVMTPLESFVCALMAYWLYLLVATAIVCKSDEKVRENLAILVKRTTRPLVASMAFVAPIAVFGATVTTIISAATVRILILALLVALFNGFIEEVFWRGLSIANAQGSLVLVLLSTLLFGVYHFSFLVLDIVYQGRAAALVGGALVMGLLWMFVARRAGSIRTSILAHQVVNLLAFTSLFVQNGF